MDLGTLMGCEEALSLCYHAFLNTAICVSKRHHVLLGFIMCY